MSIRRQVLAWPASCRMLGLLKKHLGRVSLDCGTLDLGLRNEFFSVLLLGGLEYPVWARKACPCEANRFPCVQHIDKCGVEIINLKPNGVLVLSLQDLLRLLGDMDADKAFSVHVDRLDERTTLSSCSLPVVSGSKSPSGTPSALAKTRGFTRSPAERMSAWALGISWNLVQKPIVHLGKPLNRGVERQARPSRLRRRHPALRAARISVSSGSESLADGAILAGLTWLMLLPSELAAESTSRCCISWK